MESINDLTSKMEDSPVKMTRVQDPATISSRSDRLKQPSLKDYEEWMRVKAKDLNMNHLKGLKVSYKKKKMCRMFLSIGPTIKK